LDIYEICFVNFGNTQGILGTPSFPEVDIRLVFFRKGLCAGSLLLDNLSIF